MKKIIISVFAALAAACALYAAQDTVENFTLPRFDGKQFKLEDSLGKEYIVLNFWAALQKSPGADKALFIGVNVGDSQAKAAKFVSKTKYPYLVVLDKNKAVAKKYGVLGLPVTLIISKDKKIVFRGSRPPKTFDFTK